ncbi:MAG: SDR family NAD(P)-dependent oxidoreductase [Actinobacteria bacterium]|nr:SDR family NAD(P)-dependent oxidoreductase [Actinomycetota bacterium]
MSATSSTDASLADLIDLRGKRALVTGATKGIGAATARRLAQAGAHVTVADMDPSGAATAEALVADGLSASFTTCDITNAEQLRDAIAFAADGERLDILVNNAGIFPTTGPIDAVTDDFVSRMLEVNLRAQYSASRDAARLMTQGGAIVNIASIAGIRGGANITAYSASKAGVMGLTRAFANELGAKGIRVNAIAPGVIDTPGVQDQMAPLKAGGMDIEKVIAGNPLRIAGQPDHIARAALFLASDLAAFVTGHVLVVDGGHTA